MKVEDCVRTIRNCDMPSSSLLVSIGSLVGEKEAGMGKMPENRGKITQTWMCGCVMIRLGDEKNALHWFTKGGNDPGSLRELGARLLYASGML